jgi:hypothetical protein
VISGFQARIIRTVLVRCMTGKDCGDIENDRCLLEGERVLRGRLVGERIIPKGSIVQLAKS